MISDLQFTSIVKDYYDDVYRFAYSLAGNTIDAEDLTQQAFLRLANKSSQIKDINKVKSWMFTVLRNEFLDAMRKKAKYPHVEISPTYDTEDSAPTPSGKADWQTAVQALQQLPLIFREPLALFYLEGYTYKEIAQILNQAPGTIMSRLSRGKARLQKFLQEPSPSVKPLN